MKVQSGTDRHIAIVGIGCRFPRADDIDAFWRRIEAGQVAFSEIPAGRWHHDAFFSANQRDIDTAWVASGSFLEDVDSFAALHYGIAPRRLEVMDPQQRLLIECTRLALMDAGYERRPLPRERTGVFAGLSISEFQSLTSARLTALRLAAGDFGTAAGDPALRRRISELTAHVVPIRAFTLSGSLTALASAAVAQTFDLGGPAYTIDSACASASVAVHTAVAQLRSGAIDFAIAGGAYVNLAPDNLVAFTKIGAISPTGVCRPFDHRADGFVQSDGVGLVVLKRLEDALHDNDRIYAVIRGSGCNNDGRGEGPMTPRATGQLAALRLAYEDAAVSPASVGYFEAHGTATSIGDPVEIEALGTLLQEAGVPDSAPKWVGSVKGNIGHAMAAAGMAGLLKAVKVLERRTVPPQPGFEKPHPRLGIESRPLRIPTRAHPLPSAAGSPHRVAVSSFGFGGTNSHIVLEAPPDTSTAARRGGRRPAGRPARSAEHAERATVSDRELPDAVVVSAPTTELLRTHLEALADTVEHGPAQDHRLADIAYTLNALRRHERVRAVVGARTVPELIAHLRTTARSLAGSVTALPQRPSPHIWVVDSGDAETAPPKIAFLFAGQGAQRVGLLSDLRTRVGLFDRALSALDDAARSVVEHPLTHYLYAEGPADEAEAALVATEVCQPAMAALGLALAQTLEALDVEAGVSLGHSLGEFVALAHAGVFDARDAVRLVAERGAAMRDLELSDPGTMAAVLETPEMVREVVADIPGVWVANVNHRRQVSISGTTDGVRRATEALRARGIDVRPLKVSHAFHTPILSGVDARVRALLETTKMGPPRHLAASCIAPAAHDDDAERTRRVLVDHATSPVEFVRGLEQAYAAGARLFVQVGAGTTLASFVRATLGADAHPITLAPVGSDSGYEFVRGLAVLTAFGHDVDFARLYEGEGRRVVSLPETPLVRERYWPIKGEAQPVSDRAGPPVDIPRPRGSAVAPANASATADPPAPPKPNASLIELFREQTRLLAASTEIVATQTRILAGAGGNPDVAELARLTDRIAHLVHEPATDTAVSPVPAGSRSEPNAPAPTPAEPPAPPPVGVAKADDRVQAEFLEIVAKISAFPAEALRREQRLVDELGFDSLMVADLGSAIESAFPRLPPLPASLFGLSTTVGDISDHLVEAVRATSATERSAAQAPEEAPKTASDAPGSGSGWQANQPARHPSPEPRAPARRYRVVPQVRSRPATSGQRVKGETWLVLGDHPTLGGAITRALESRNARVLQVQFVESGEAGPPTLGWSTVNRWPRASAKKLSEALEEVTVDGLVFAVTGERPLEILHPVAAQSDVRRFITLTSMGGRLGLERTPELKDNLHQAAVAGYTKALARERPDRVVRTFDIKTGPDVDHTATWVADEIEGGDGVPEVGFDGRRWVAAFTPPDASRTAVRAPRTDDVVLITGATGYIGRAVARHVLGRGAGALVLLGRRPADGDMESLLAEAEQRGTPARYVAVGLSDREELRRTLDDAQKELGPITAVFHAAGHIEDARVPQKTQDSVERVLEPKLTGLEGVVAATPSLREVVLFSSWAARFGNIGQADYAGANQLLDAYAVATENHRVISLEWPPWRSSPMVNAIPRLMREAIAAEGVPFIDDTEALSLLDEAVASSFGGVELVARDMPPDVFSARHHEVVSLARHPYLEDHRLKGRPVMPLASAADLLAWAFLEAAQTTLPLTLRDVSLVRGVMGNDVLELSVRGRSSPGRPAEGQLEIRSSTEAARGDRPVAYRAEACVETDHPPARRPLDGEPLGAGMPLEAFYATATFHGPRLHGIVSIDAVTTRGIRGRVRASRVADWLPDGERTGWVIDPLAVDGAFQLAAYWLVQQHGRTGFPTGVERLVVLRDPGPGPLEAICHLGEVDDDRFRGDVGLYDDAGEMVVWLEGVCGMFADLRGEGRTQAASREVPEEHYRIDRFPEYEALHQRFEMAALVGIEDPYFHEHQGTARDTSIVRGVEMLNFSSYNYLGFSGHSEVLAATREAIERYGTSVSASRVASGERPIHRDLEAGIAEHLGVAGALVFVSGHATNVTTVGHLFDKQDLILHDSLIHDSILQGIFLSGATRRPFPHNDTAALAKALAQLRTKYRRVLICAEGIYSMDGDTCDLPRLIELKKQHRAMLLIDEAHSAGVLGPAGRGIGHHFAGVDPNDVDIWMGTLSKSYASCGGYIAGSEALIRYLKYTAPGFVYSAGITPANAAAALKSLELMKRQPEVVDRLRRRSRFFLERVRARGIDTGDAIGAAVVPAIVKNSLLCVHLSANLARRNINVQPIVYPAVEDEKARLRFFISALHTEPQLAHAAEVLAEEFERTRAEVLGDTPAVTV